MATKAASVDTAYYPDSDGKPMAESDLHRNLMFDLIDRLKLHFADRTDVYVTGNLLVYYVQGSPGYSLAPDCFVAFGVPRRERRSYKVWEERNRYPDVVIELTSDSTEEEDRTQKWEVYQDVWRVKEYFIFDPRRDYLDPPLRGFRLVRNVFRPLTMVNGRLTSKRLGVTFERDADRLVVRNAETGLLVETPAERAERERDTAQAAEIAALAERDRAIAENARLLAELAALKKRKS